MSKLVLTHYYDTLPKRIAPKSDFVRLIAARCQVVEATVRLWIKGECKPNNPEHIEIISEVTGIEVDKLFENTDEEL